MNGTHPPLFGLPRIIGDLRAKLGAWNLRGFIATALAHLLFGRLGRILGKMEALARAYQAGTLRRHEARRVAAPRVVREGDGTRGVALEPELVGFDSRERGSATGIWPTRFGWLVRAAGWEAAGFGLQLRAILEQPETQAFLQACPQAVRTLLPLCWMLSIETSAVRAWVKVPEKVPAEPDAVRPKRVRKPRPQPEPFRVPIPPGVMAWVRRERRLKRG